MSDSELINIVSKDDEIIGVEKRSIVHEKKLNFRGVNAFIINTQGELWIPRRHPQKTLFPLHLDASVGGHVLAYESYDEAFARETKEETNIDICAVPHKTIGRLTPYQHGTSAFIYVYAIYQNIEPTYNKKDFIEAYWLSPTQLLQLIENGEKAKGDLPIIIRYLQKQLS
ncbi:MAG TPA: NUDIX domain-containing protein [Candidatus Dependentiae bacterium]|nr:NUDIX domain-containing protein [Candidatus Dependentiae bacterium]